jgi:uroporphyrin-3 C-methyltransferase
MDPPHNAAPTPAGSAAPPPGAGPLARPVSRGVLAAVTLGLVVAVLVAWFDARQSHLALRTEVARRLTDTDVTLGQLKARETDHGNELRDAQAKLTLLEARLAESQTQQASLEALYREMAPSRDELALNEVEQVLVLASQQLGIARNVQAALAALQLADAKLARIDRPQLIPLRRAVSRDIDRLKSVPFVDVAGMSLKLDQAVSLINTLPLAKDERLPETAPAPPPANEPAWRRFLREAWSEVRSLIRVEVDDRVAAPLIPPPQQYFLRESLRLRLLTARVALLSHDDIGFRSDVTAANAWLKQYFDTRTKVVQTLSASLAQLAATPMPDELPDIAASMTALRMITATRERGADKAGVAGGGR